MKHKTLLAIVAGTLFTVMGQVAFADEAPATSVAMSAMIQNLQKAGYVAIREVKFDDDKYEAKVITANGQALKVQLNPQGEPMTPTRAANKLSILDAANKVEAAGYAHISKIEAEDNGYKVRAYDAKGKKVSLMVNGTSGNIDKKWFD
jgi:hypothetical protein